MAARKINGSDEMPKGTEARREVWLKGQVRKVIKQAQTIGISQLCLCVKGEPHTVSASEAEAEAEDLLRKAYRMKPRPLPGLPGISQAYA